MDSQQIELELIDIIGQFEASIPEPQAKDMRELAFAGEPGVAFENLCTQLSQYEVVVPLRLFERLKRLGSAMQIQEEYWQRLKIG